jgi:hypothetical protein
LQVAIRPESLRRVQVDSSQTLEVSQRVGVLFDSQQSTVFG